MFNRTDLDLLLGEFLAAAHLADLVRLVVAARRARGAVVFAHAADALAAALPLLLALLVAAAVQAAVVARLDRPRPAAHLVVVVLEVDRVLETAPGARHARHLGVGSVAAGALQGRRAVLPLLLLAPVSGAELAGRRQRAL